ncbi:molybdate ABC transporter substrate-binding protein [Alkalibacillus salilacus]|uniref:Molybdate transport system substrate-binding protein n=1 Tax=Alkalibacillus salilacus TaxID=284582 RepID=A0ABT9VBB8_9BACI|nr:molybdate ABC transporter substrate-binding protein [Alkalibacillus salilacus]MDQ0158263.1 molybdate transport system substrate-binding protein [Alkalibacillus salilacus]
MVRKLWLVMCLIVLILTACQNTDKNDEDNLTVAVSSGLYHPMEQLINEFTQKTDIDVSVTYGATETLAVQLKRGAPYDAFLAADYQVMERLADDAVDMPEEPTFAFGRLAFVYQSNFDFEQFQSIVMANPETAPFGRAANEVLQHKSWWDEEQYSIIYGANMRATIYQMKTGDIDAGLISLSFMNDLNLPYEVIETSQHEPIKHVMGRVIDSEVPEATIQKWFEFLKSNQAKEILQENGFDVP